MRVISVIAIVILCCMVRSSSARERSLYHPESSDDANTFNSDVNNLENDLPHSPSRQVRHAPFLAGAVVGASVANHRHRPTYYSPNYYYPSYPAPGYNNGYYHG